MYSHTPWKQNVDLERSEQWQLFNDRTRSVPLSGIAVNNAKEMSRIIRRTNSHMATQQRQLVAAANDSNSVRSTLRTIDSSILVSTDSVATYR